MSKIDFLQRLESLTDVIDNLQFTRQAVESGEFDPATLESLLRDLEKLSQRSQDVNLYLAVVGEFNAGKSTLINALLRDPLLKSSIYAMTTAAATSIRFGDEIGLTFRIVDNRQQVFTFAGESQECYVPIVGFEEKKLELRALIEAITAEDEIAKQITDVRITHPARFLMEGITIIDTPGVNVDQPDHLTVTHEVVENLADAALVVIPATEPLSQSLSQFLETMLKPYLHRCVFLFTKIDLIPENERENLVIKTQQRIGKFLDIPNPVLYPVAGQIVLDSINGNGSKGGSLANEWVRHFEELEQTIRERLQQERILSIAESVLRLLDHLFDRIQSALTEQWQNYTATQQMMEGHIIQDIDAFADTALKKSMEKLLRAGDEARKQSQERVAYYREQTKTKLLKGMNTASNVNGLKKFAKEDAPKIISKKQDKLLKELQAISDDLSNAAQNAQQDFDQEFNKVYDQLKTLNSKATKASVQNKSTALDSSSIISEISTVSGEVWTEIGGGVAAGAMAGAAAGMILPVVGTIFGAVVGGIIGGFLSNKNIQTYRDRAWHAAEPKIDAAFDDIELQVLNDFEKSIAKLRKHLKTHVNRHVKEYGEIVPKLQKEQKKEKKRLTTLEANVRRNLEEIETRRQRVSQQQETLKAQFKIS